MRCVWRAVRLIASSAHRVQRRHDRAQLLLGLRFQVHPPASLQIEEHVADIESLVDAAAESRAERRFWRSVLIPEDGLDACGRPAWQEIERPVGEWIAPRDAIRIQHGADACAALAVLSIFSTFDQDVDRPQVAVQQVGDGDLVQQVCARLGQIAQALNSFCLDSGM